MRVLITRIRDTRAKSRWITKNPVTTIDFLPALRDINHWNLHIEAPTN